LLQRGQDFTAQGLINARAAAWSDFTGRGVGQTNRLQRGQNFTAQGLINARAAAWSEFTGRGVGQTH